MAEPLPLTADAANQQIRELVTPLKVCPWCCQEHSQPFPAQATTWLCERHRLALQAPDQHAHSA